MKRIIFLTVIFLSVCEIQGQSLQNILQRREQMMQNGTSLPVDSVIKADRPSEHVSIESVCRAVRGELALIRQQYVLNLGNDSYGRDGKPFYGESYSLGIKVAGGMFLQGCVVEPWKDDEAYKRVNADGKYEPKLYWSYQRALDGGEYQAVELDHGKPYIAPANADKSLYLHVDAQSDFGLTIDATAGQKQGTMIWAQANTNVQDSAMVVQLTSKSMTLTAGNGKTVIDVTPDNAEHTIGGLFVVPKYERGGRVQYQLAGVAVKTAEGKWALQLLTSADESAGSDNPTPSEPQKQDSNADAPTPIKK